MIYSVYWLGIFADRERERSQGGDSDEAIPMERWLRLGDTRRAEIMERYLPTDRNRRFNRNDRMRQLWRARKFDTP